MLSQSHLQTVAQRRVVSSRLGCAFSGTPSVCAHNLPFEAIAEAAAAHSPTNKKATMMKSLAIVNGGCVLGPLRPRKNSFTPVGNLEAQQQQQSKSGSHTCGGLCWGCGPKSNSEAARAATTADTNNENGDAGSVSSFDELPFDMDPIMDKSEEAEATPREIPLLDDYLADSWSINAMDRDYQPGTPLSAAPRSQHRAARGALPSRRRDYGHRQCRLGGPHAGDLLRAL